MSDLPNGIIEDEAAVAIKDGLSVENGLRLSAAMSLKRIADRLERITTTFGDGSLGQLNVGIEGNINVANHY